MLTRTCLAVLVLAGFLATAACRTSAPAPTQLPDPSAFEASPEERLDEQQRRAVRGALEAAERGDFGRAERLLDGLPAANPVVRLVRLEVRLVRGEPVAGEMLALAQERPEWRTAWELAYLAARREGDAERAFEAVRRLAQLAPNAGWEGEARSARRALADELVSGASARLAAGDHAGALQASRRALELDPERTEARLTMARAHLAAGRPSEAAALVPALPDTPEALDVKGRVAEALGQWELAAQLFGSLPSSYPGRCESLVGAQSRLRRANAPPYVTRAFAAETLERMHLAVLLAWEVPALAAKDRGEVALFEDIVQLPEGRDIVTTVRAGLLEGDVISRRFRPHGVVDRTELATVLDKLASALGRERPRWCDSTDTAECLALPGRPDGERTAELIRRVAHGGDTTCTGR
jgi:tetratricopeptide (TPR) repeat protein